MAARRNAFTGSMNATPIEMPTSIIEEAGNIADKNEAETEKKESKPSTPSTPEKMVTTDDQSLVRKTYFLTYEQIETLDYIRRYKRVPTSEFVREAVQEKLEREFSDILELDEIKDKANMKRALVNK